MRLTPIVPAALFSFLVALSPALADPDGVEGDDYNVVMAEGRGGVTFGGALGLGHIDCEAANCDSMNEAGSLDVHVGMLIGPQLGVLVDFWGMTHRQDDASFSQGIATAGLRFWPTRRIWLGAGVGVARVSWNYDGEFIDVENQTETVPAAMAAVGVEVLSSPTFALDIALRGGQGFYEDDVQVQNLSLGLGVNWY